MGDLGDDSDSGGGGNMPKVFGFDAIPPTVDEATTPVEGNEPKLGILSLPNDFMLLLLLDKAAANGFCFAYARNPFPNVLFTSSQESNEGRG